MASGKWCYSSHDEGDKKRRKSLDTTSYHVAKVRLRNFEVALAQDILDELHLTQTTFLNCR